MARTTVTLELKGLAELRAALAAAAAATAGEPLAAAAAAGGEPVRDAARERVSKRSRTLERAIAIRRTRVERRMAEIDVGVFAGPARAYARIHELGGVIVPRRRRFLRFVVDDRVVFTRRVVRRPRPYLRPAFDERRERAVAAVGASLRAGLGRAAR